jgi:hypothetical protein
MLFEQGPNWQGSMLHSLLLGLLFWSTQCLEAANTFQPVNTASHPGLGLSGSLSSKGGPPAFQLPGIETKQHHLHSASKQELITKPLQTPTTLNFRNLAENEQSLCF